MASSPDSIPPAITVKENITDEAAGATIYFRRDPQRILIPGSGDNGDAYSVSGIPTQLQYSITGFLDTNSNGVLDRLIDPHVHFLDGGLMPGTDFNDLNIDLPHVDLRVQKSVSYLWRFRTLPPHYANNHVAEHPR